MNLTSDFIHSPVSGCHVEFGRGKKKRTVIDACRFTHKQDCNNEVYEVATIRGDGTEIEIYRTDDWQDMQAAYARMVRAYCPDEWKPLVSDLKKAKAIAEAVTGDDGGTCNMDSPAMEPPKGLTYDQFVGICKAAGISSYSWKPWPKAPKQAVLCGAVGIGQGYRRTKGAELSPGARVRVRYVLQYGLTLLDKQSIIKKSERRGSDMTKVYNLAGTEIDYEAAVELMDDVLRENLADDLAPCTEQEFFTAYEKAHAALLGAEWELSKENPVY